MFIRLLGLFVEFVKIWIRREFLDAIRNWAIFQETVICDL